MQEDTSYPLVDDFVLGLVYYAMVEHGSTCYYYDEDDEADEADEVGHPFDSFVLTSLHLVFEGLSLAYIHCCYHLNLVA